MKAPGWHPALLTTPRQIGKVREAARWVIEQALADSRARIALVSGGDRTRMVQCIQEAARTEAEQPAYIPSERRLVWESGAEARLYRSSDISRFCGPRHTRAWVSGTVDLELWRVLFLTLREDAQMRFETSVFETPLYDADQEPETAVDEALVLVLAEHERATAKHGPGGFHSLHEAYGVMLEELEEFWEEVRSQDPERQQRAVKEATQLAALALRFIAYHR